MEVQSMKYAVKYFSALLFLMLLTCSFSISAYADEGDPVEYIDENGEIQYCTDYQILNTDNFPDEPGVELGTGWYVVEGKVAYQNRICISAAYDAMYAEEYDMEPARLILCDSCELNLKQGIELGQDYGLTIFGQSGGTGTLNADYNYYLYDEVAHAVIGGNAPKEFGGYLEINGGIINVTGNTDGACIGGSVGGALEEVNIHGGKITLENTVGGPAIGVGLSYTRGNYGRVNISGGEIYADSHFETIRTCDAIGGHYECGGLKEMTITGGKVAAFGRYATVGMDPCAMMTYGSLVLGDDMTVSAGYDPDHISPAAKDKRVEAIRSNCYAEVTAPGYSGSSTSAAASAFNGGIATILLFAAAVLIVILMTVILLRRKKNQL